MKKQIIITDGTKLSEEQKALLDIDYTVIAVPKTDIVSMEKLADKIIYSCKMGEVFDTKIEVIFVYHIPILIMFLSFAEGIKAGKGNTKSGIEVRLIEKYNNNWRLI